MDMNNKFVDVLSNNGMAYTENGALTHQSTGSVIADQFGKAANYRGRTIDDVFFDEGKLWSENPEYALRFPFYLRIVTRKVKVNDDNITENVQKGQGARDEAFKRLLYIALNHSDIFYKNIWVLPLVGSWKDIWTLMFYDEFYGINVIKKDKMFDILNEGLASKTHIDLVKKFMPRIKSGSHCKGNWTKIANKLAKEFASYNHWSYEKYNHIKTSGKAHDFQKIICRGEYDKINWNAIPGKAINLLSSNAFIDKHNLLKTYTDWLVKQPTVKFTGYPFELGSKVLESIYNNEKVPIYKTITWNKQFDELIKKGSENGKMTGNVWCAIDTSSSMNSFVASNIKAIDICLSLGIYFATLNTGAFHKNIIMFDSVSHALKLEGDFCHMMKQIVKDHPIAWGSTNFLSIADELVRIRQNNPDIPLDDYPKTILVVSDMQFNPAFDSENEKTNFDLTKEKLYAVFPKKWVDSMKFIWWDCAARRNKDFPATIDDGGCYYVSGFDGSIISMICGNDIEKKEKETVHAITMDEVIGSAFNQEIMQLVKLNG